MSENGTIGVSSLNSTVQIAKQPETTKPEKTNVQQIKSEESIQSTEEKLREEIKELKAKQAEVIA